MGVGGWFGWFIILFGVDEWLILFIINGCWKWIGC